MEMLPQRKGGRPTDDDQIGNRRENYSGAHDDEDFDVEDNVPAEEVVEEEELPEAVAASDEDGYSLRVRMSESLYGKLRSTAREEGVSIDEFACELLAE